MADAEEATATGTPETSSPSPIETPSPADIPALAPPPGIHSEAADWWSKVGQEFADHFSAKAVADQNDQTGQQVVRDVSDFQNMLSGLVAQDPSATGMAVRVAGMTAESAVADHPYLPDEQKPQVAAQLAQEMQGKVALTGIMAAADHSADTAHEMLNTWGMLFPEGEGLRDAVESHIDLAAEFRRRDNDQGQIIADKAKTTASSAKLMQYAGALVDPKGEATIPPKFNTQVFKDQSITPAHTALAQQLATHAATAAIGGETDVTTSAVDVMDYLKGFAQGQKTPEDALGLITANKARMQDGVLLAQLAQNPQDAKTYGSILAAVTRRFAGPDAAAVGTTASARTDALAHDLLVRYRDMGSAAFKDLPQDPAALARNTDRVLGYKQWPSLNEIFQRPDRAESAVTVLRGSGPRGSVPAAELGVTRAAEDYASVSARERARIVAARQTMLPDEARIIQQDAQTKIEAARRAHDDARQRLVEERVREHKDALALTAQQRRQDRAERLADAATARQERINATIEATQERAAERASARRSGGGGGGGGGRAPLSPIEEFRRGYALTRKL